MALKYFLSIFLSLAVFELSAQIQISESNSSRYVFSWNLQNYEITEIDSGQKFSEISFSTANTILGEDGEAVLPGYSILLGIPPEGDIRVSFSSEAVKTVPLKSPVLKHKNLITRRQPDLIFNNSWICEPVYGKLQGIRTARLIIRPFIHDEKTNTLKVLQSGTCTIEFPSYPTAATSITKVTNQKLVLSNNLVNYSVAEGWYRDGRLAKVAASAFPITAGQKVYRFSIGDGNAGFNEMTTNENGILKIPGGAITTNFGRIKINEVALYASFKGELPVGSLEISGIPSGLVEVPLMRIDRNRNTFVDEDDYFLAFVTGASDWTYDESGRYTFRFDRYDDYRKYWLTASSGKTAEIDLMQASNIAGETVFSVDNRIIFSKSLIQSSGNEGGLSWFWENINNVNSYNLQLPGLDTSFGGGIIIKANRPSSVLAFLGEPLISDMDKYIVNKWGDRNLRISTKSDMLELQSIEVHYKRKLIIGDAEKLEFFSPADSLFCTYSLQVTTNDLLYIFRISNDEKRVSLVDTIRNFANRSFTWADTGGRGIRYMICSERALSLLPERSAAPNKVKSDFLVDNLRAVTDSTDFLIITGADFTEASLKLAAHKKKIGFKAPRVVVVKDVYDAFSGGDVDPAAIRNFITYVQNYWKNSKHLDYVLLFGSGNYDYKGVSPRPQPIHIPVYYDGFTVLEDFFTTHNGVSQAVVGRITCNKESEAFDVVDKIIAMEDPEKADYSDWRNRALFVADDDMQGSTHDGIAHHKSSDYSTDVIEKKNPAINMNKVYLFDYKWNSAGQKPEASKAVFNVIDNGVGYVNYFGHGSHLQWAQEKVLLNENVINLKNENRYPLISSFSCSVGRFDSPEEPCLSSVLVTTGKCGAIATISSTRTAYASSNERLAINFYSVLFDQDTISSIGMAFYKAKDRNFSNYSRSYAILGDPSIIINKPVYKVKMEIHNKAGLKKDTLMALEQITVKGTVEDKNGSVISGFGSPNEPAFIHLGLFNSPEEAGRKDGGADISVRYKMPGRAVFMGRTEIHNGRFQQVIQLPGNLTFNKPGVKLTAYAWRDGRTEAASGFKDTLIFSGTDSTVSNNDTSGPQITIRPVHDYPEFSTEKMSFNNQVIVMDSLKCEIDIFDSNGVDVIGIGPDEGITLEIEGFSSKQNINHKFRFNEGDFRKGSVLIREHALKPGTYTLKLSARDLQGNLSKASFVVKITPPEEFKLDRVFNSPNPFKMGRGTKFYFFPTCTSCKTHVAIKIYTLSGKPVCVIKNAVNGQFWDGRDQAGTLLSPDIYLYQIVGSAPQQNKQVKSKIMKLVINP